ncbi:2-succinyl-6-hydroxy-2 4-cyclohexadiene-1-carboxylate synthase [termite gut metagenome]|uniref:2-succinyl-6-hydroxy-2 4-cyclohexadiene-1-carboxylate synthase n=3 Tax=termite gut metagenome TaxID=433724 RepID=A0A5J4QK65_9ZZZZ
MKRKTICIGLIVTILLLLVGIVAGGGFYLLDYALSPQTARNDEASSYEELTTGYPFLTQWVDSLNETPALKDTVILNKEGIRLHAYYVPATFPTAKTAVIVHGYGDHSLRMMMIGYMYHHDLGFNILLPDLQSHGKSEGQAVQMGWKDRLDVMEWMTVANNIFDNNTQMVVHGISMGAATTMMIAGEEQPNFVKCFIEDCGYTSVWDEFSEELENRFQLPKFPFLYVSDWLCRQKYGWSFKEASSLKQIKKSILPMLFIHGDADTFVPTHMVYSLYEAKPEPKELWVVPGVGHAISYKKNKEEYTCRVKAFVEKYIR